MTIVTKQRNRFTETEIDDEFVVMHLGTGEFLSLTGTGAAIWRLLDGKRDRAELLAELSSRFDGDRAQMYADMDGFLRRLEDLGLVEID